jgi:ATP-dependent protease Clp ATPase subunit
MKVHEQKQTISEISKVIEIFKASDCKIRPHFILLGPSGSGKSYTVQALAEQFDTGYLEINAAQLTKEGTSGNSLSKALSPIAQTGGKPTIVFVDEFDKLFISGNSNSQLAHESTNGVQNEFLKVLEADEASVFGDYGKYVNVSVKNILFIFAGAFNGEENITIDRLREFGIKTEFIGRVGLIYNLEKLTLESLINILEKSPLLKMYLDLFEDTNREDAIKKISNFIEEYYENNTLGARLVNTLIHQYFIKGGELGFEEAKIITFQKKLKFDEGVNNDTNNSRL